jgi:hypothetical protein
VRRRALGELAYDSSCQRVPGRLASAVLVAAHESPVRQDQDGQAAHPPKNGGQPDRDIGRQELDFAEDSLEIGLEAEQTAHRVE